MPRPRVAWFTPLPPVESGISLYSQEILPILSQVMRIDVIVDGYTPIVRPASETLGIVDHRRFDPDMYELIVYQVGNSPAHRYMLPEMYRNPGLLVLHDTMLNHLMIQDAVHRRDLLGYREEMERRYGGDGRRAAERVLTGQSPDDLFRFPMSEPLIEASRATIVHSDFARQQVRSWAPDAVVERVPLGLKLPELLDRLRARQILGIPEDQFLLASVSHINPHKRIDVVLRALKSLRRSIPARLILAGSVSPQFPLARMVNHLDLDQVVDTPGYVTDAEARLIAAAADVIVSLRYPTAGETSASLLHSMAAGRPVLVSQTGSFTEAPADATVRIPVDALEEQTLTAVLKRLATDNTLRDSIGERARSFVEEEHSLRRWTDGYLYVMSRLTGISVDSPEIDETPEPVDRRLDPTETAVADPLTESLARDVAELGLGGDEDLLLSLARSRVELGI